jgi:hypothetical protein
MRIFVEAADIDVGSFAGENILERRPSVPLPTLPWTSVTGPNPALEVVSACCHDWLEYWRK